MKIQSPFFLKRIELNRIFYIFFLCTFPIFGQTEGALEFYPLKLADTISDFNKIKSLNQIDSLKSSDYFFLDTYQNVEGLFFVKKKENKCLVFDFELHLYLGPNTSVSNIKKENNRFVSIQTFRSPSGACANRYGQIILFDIMNFKFISFFNLNQSECYNDYGEISSNSECRAVFKISDEFLEIKSNKKPNDGLWCKESAEYRIEVDKLVKTKYYSETNKRFYPIICYEEDNICTGMNFNALKKKFPNGILEEVPMYEYGYDSDKLGTEFITNGEKQIFVIVDVKNKVTGISFVSSKYKFNGINTETTVFEVLEKYPNYKLHIDLISDWEFIYLKEEKIKLNFKTDNTNRIGIYGADFEEGTSSIKRNSATVDLIQL